MSRYRESKQCIWEIIERYRKNECTILTFDMQCRSLKDNLDGYKKKCVSFFLKIAHIEHFLKVLPFKILQLLTHCPIQRYGLEILKDN